MNTIYKNSKTLFTFLVALVSLFVPKSALADFDSNGFGIGNDAGKYQEALLVDGSYEIGNAGQLYWFADLVNRGYFYANAKLTNNIVVNEDVIDKVGAGDLSDLRMWIPIGKSYDYCYTGNFDGQGFSISGLYYNNKYDENIGLFGYLRTKNNYSPTISNIILKDSHFSASQYIGGICGFFSADEGTIYNCKTNISATSSSYTGGICGYLSVKKGIAVEKCFSNGNISCPNYAGGVCGNFSQGTINNCGFAGTVTNGQNCGGICGLVGGYLTNSFCYVESPDIKISSQANVNISNCYYLSGTETADGGRTAAQFRNGEVCYLLNNGDTSSDVVWRQIVNSDIIPSFDGDIVAGSSCTHNYIDGVCSICGSVKKLEKDSEGYYLISSVADLKWFANQVNGGQVSIYGRLTDNITFDGETPWQPMGLPNNFTGKFDGNGHTISGLYINSDSNYGGVGLFAAIENATIENLTIENAKIEAKSYVGGFCGYAINSTISKCYFDGEIKASGYYVGGICGNAKSKTTITQCGNKASITASQYVAGITYGASETYNTPTVTNCFNWGNIQGQYSCGILYANGSVSYCYNIGTAVYEIKINQNNVYNCYALGKSTNATGATIKSKADFETGTVCKLLNNYSNVWSQKVGIDLYPTFDVKNILSQESLKCSHDYINGFCSKCEGFEPAVLNENDNYYEISNAGQLYWFASSNNVSKARLTDDIIVNDNFDARNFSNIANLRKWTAFSYSGELDGQDHTISGLYCDETTKSAGLFSTLNGAKISNLKIRNSYFHSEGNVGGIAGYSDNAIITNCSVDGLIKGEGYTGGLCGNARGTSISKCYVLADVHDVASAGSRIYIGGICGLSESYCTIEHCYVAGKVVSINNYKGAISGYGDSYKTTDIKNCIYVGESTGLNLFMNVKSNDCYNINGNEDIFESGEICWELNGYSSEGVWRQTLGTDKYPTFEGLKVSQAGENTYINKKEPVLVNGYYELADAEDLYWFAKKVNEGETDINGRIIANITLNKNVLAKVEAGETEGLREWTPIGNGQYQYKGAFNGGGFVISGLYYNSFNSFAGLFGFCDDAKIITNVHLRDAYINGNNYPTAGICGYSSNRETTGYISKCSFDGKISGALTAGICNNTTVPIKDCYNLGTIVGGYGIGNAMNPALISNCYSIGSRVVGGYANNCYFLSEEETDDGGRTAEQFANGRVCWELNNGSTEGVWRQNNGDNYPSFVGDIIDFTSCNHDYSRGNGICNKCGTKCQHEEHTITGICTICGLTCEHHYIDSKCVCGAVCEHRKYIDGKCAICGAACSHNHYENGACSVCGSFKAPDQDEEGYYLLANANNLYWFADYVNNTDATINARVVNDITVNENLIKKINNSEFDGLKFWNPIIEFQGKFDGGGHIISGIVCGDISSGFFKSAFNADIHGLNIRDSYFSGWHYAAGICVHARGKTKISNCSFDGLLTEAEANAGICCENSGSIENCYNLASIEKGMGICAINSGTISNCYNYNVNALSPIYYDPLNNGIVENCYYLSDKETEDGGRTKEQFQYGKVCWELNAKRTDENVVWRQHVGTDPYPIFVGNIVEYKQCTEHHYVEGICDVCGTIKLPELVDGYYLLANVNDLYWFAKNVNSGNTKINARLLNDIIVNKEQLSMDIVSKFIDEEEVNLKSWTPIGKDLEMPYAGTFDGGNYTISGLFGFEEVYSGFFAWTNGATITNLNIRNSIFVGEVAAGICIASENGQISKCSFDGIVYGEMSSGICLLNKGEILDCCNYGSVELGAGICDLNSGIITSCYNFNVNVTTQIDNPNIGPYYTYGKQSNCYYLSDKETVDGGRTAAQFADGTVTALLNNGRTGDDIVWYQNDKYPGFEFAEEIKDLILNETSIAFDAAKTYETITYTRALSNNWNSICLPFAFNASDCNKGGTAVTFFTVKGIDNDGTVELVQVASVGAGQPVLFYTLANDLHIEVKDASTVANPVNDTYMKGEFAETKVISTGNEYYLKDNQLFQSSSFIIKPFRAYITGAPSGKGMKLVVADGIAEEATETVPTLKAIFNAAGQQVDHMNEKGIYILQFSDGSTRKVHLGK